VVIGQKDFRKPKNSSPTFFIVKNGELEEIGSKGVAYGYYLNYTKKEVNYEKLKAEKESLLGRLSEIEELLESE